MTGSVLTRRLRFAALLVVAVGSTGCATPAVQSPGTVDIAAQLSVERFLQAANARDLNSMGRIFGTRDGPVLDTGSTFGCMFKKIGS